MTISLHDRCGILLLSSGSRRDCRMHFAVNSGLACRSRPAGQQYGVRNLHVAAFNVNLFYYVGHSLIEHTTACAT